MSAIVDDFGSRVTLYTFAAELAHLIAKPAIEPKQDGSLNMFSVIWASFYIFGSSGPR